MLAIGYQISRPIETDDALVDFETPEPVATGRDLLVEVRAISVNPVDTKVRVRSQPEDGGHKILGWDAAGTVVAAGPEVTDFKIGDEVFYAGDITRPGTNSEFHLVDERIVGKKPASLSFSEAAALPLTAITAWEMLFDRLRINSVNNGKGDALLIIGGAGGVGSMAVQLARQLTDITVIGTASRPETSAWVSELGAHHVVDHSKALSDEIDALGIGAPGLVFSTTNTDQHLDQVIQLIAPQGRFGLIDDPATFEISGFKLKSISAHWEMMFTRSMFQTDDMGKQGELLNEVSRLVDAGKLRTTLGEHFGRINAANLKRAHAFIESGRAKGKVVLEGFGPNDQ